VEVMVNVLDFSDIPTKVKLARCNPTLQRRVYRECSEAWFKIACNSSSVCRERLTDQDLSILLTRVNAREVTIYLNLNGCENIRGSGLEPLRNSQVLEGINLRETGAGENPTPFIWTLRTMIPHRLHDVRFGTEIQSEPRVLDFIRHLRNEKVRLAREQDIRCESCQEPVSDRSQQIVPSFNGLPLLRCSDCDGNFCRRGNCPTEVRDCRICGEGICDSCAEGGYLERCDSCGHDHCVDCTYIAKCNECDKQFCRLCHEGNKGLFGCVECDVEEVCFECGTCPEICNTCMYCKTCRGKMSCHVCEARACFMCTPEAIRCHYCSKYYCGKPECLDDKAIMCVVCEDMFCKDCKAHDRCNGCETSFCKDHLDRLVDCKACETRHCRRNCDSVERCPYCQAACFEDCDCEKKPAPKRARLA